MANRSQKVVFITGCSSGLGRSLALEFFRTGHHVIATARDPHDVAELSSLGLSALPLDVTSDASVASAVTAALSIAGRLDIVINNAGTLVAGPLAEVPISTVLSSLNTNLVGVARVVREVFPSMAARCSGRIVNIGSIVGLVPTPFAGVYCMCKAALRTMSEVLRVETRPFGIDVILVEAGGIRSNIATSAMKDVARYGDASSRYRPLHHHIRARASMSQNAPMDATAFARRLVPELTRDRPRRVIRCGSRSSWFPALRFLPGGLVDWAMMRTFGLDQFTPLPEAAPALE
jgi:NAD(P)-dependent dehydrogenase (short-subunit alcohol dehydrogenase family)